MYGGGGICRCGSMQMWICVEVGVCVHVDVGEGVGGCDGCSETTSATGRTLPLALESKKSVHVPYTVPNLDRLALKDAMASLEGLSCGGKWQAHHAQTEILIVVQHGESRCLMRGGL